MNKFTNLLASCYTFYVCFLLFRTCRNDFQVSTQDNFTVHIAILHPYPRSKRKGLLIDL